jgi:hypothetical protein
VVLNLFIVVLLLLAIVVVIVGIALPKASARRTQPSIKDFDLFTRSLVSSLSVNCIAPWMMLLAVDPFLVLLPSVT